MSQLRTAFLRVLRDMSDRFDPTRQTQGYARPQDPWICGRLAEGKPCVRGPDEKGGCRGGYECQPWLKNDRWECRRSHLQGGPCEQGPLSDGTCCRKIETCVPVASVRTRRSSITRWAIALAVGLVAVILAGGIGNELLMPGPLNSSHANLGDCKTCHAAVGTGKLDWVHNLVEGASAQKNAKLCIRCHEVGEDAFAAHTHPVADLRRLTELRVSSEPNTPFPEEKFGDWVRYSIPAPQSRPGKSEIYCATCHEEHQGSAGNLMEVPDTRCQTCHVKKFGKFAQSHPQFTDYPFTRRTRLIFDHKSHFAKHFPKTKETNDRAISAPGYCSDCHVQGEDKKYMETGSFNAMCSQCHTADIRGVNRASGPKGIQFLTVPGLDLAVISERGVDIGAWPEDSEAEVTPFMRSLLASILDGRDIVSEVSDLELLDLTDASDEDLAKVQDLAWAVKRLFWQTENSGLQSFMSLPLNSEGDDLEHKQMGNMSGVMSRDVIASANREWFPSLTDELQKHAAGEKTHHFAALIEENEQNTEAPEQETEESDLEITDSDILDEGDDGVLGDELETETDELFVDDLSLEDAAGTDDEILNGIAKDEDLESLDLEAGAEDAAILEETDDGDILGDSLETPNSDPLLSSDESDDVLVVDDSTLNTPLEENAAEQADDMAGSVSLLGSESLDPEAWAALGGWYRRDYSLNFRPSGHSDKFLWAWLTFSGYSYGSPKESQFAPVFEQLSPSDAVGRCTKCHSVDDESGHKHVQWHAFSSEREANRFTTFSHGPHIGTENSEGCAMCHQMTGGHQGFLDTYNAGNTSDFVKTFKPIEKATCSSCHTERAAGEECTLCHQYHTTDIGHPMTRTSLPTE